MSAGGGSSPPAGSGDGTWAIRLRDRAGAVERLLSVLRRRVVPVERFSLVRCAGGVLEAEVTLVLEAHLKDRMVAEIRALADVETCVPGPGAVSSGAPTTRSEPGRKESIPTESTQRESTQTDSTQTQRTEDHAR